MRQLCSTVPAELGKELAGLWLKRPLAMVETLQKPSRKNQRQNPCEEISIHGLHPKKDRTLALGIGDRRPIRSD
jgi:hypothetical protein